MSMSHAPIISVIIPAFNAEQTLGLQLRALARQTDAPPFEVLVADNRSTDTTAEVARSVGEAEWLDVRVVSAAEHQGTSYARNVAASQARADLLMFCDADDVVGEYWLAHGLRAFDTTDLWTGGALLVTDDVYATEDIDAIRAAFFDGLPYAPPEQTQTSDFPVLSGGNFGCTAALFRQLGGFDQSFPINGEDNDFAFRAKWAGHEMYDASNVTLAYRGRWEPAVRRKLARRSARSHAQLVSRYHVRHLSPYPRTLVEAGKILVYPLVAATGRRPWDREEFGYRLARWCGFAEGRLRYGYLKQDPGPQLGVGGKENA